MKSKPKHRCEDCGKEAEEKQAGLCLPCYRARHMRIDSWKENLPKSAKKPSLDWYDSQDFVSGFSWRRVL